MKINTLKSSCTTLIILLFAVCVAIGQETKAEHSNANASQAVVGSWQFLVTSESSPQPFRGLMTFSEGGGVVASAQGDILLSPPPGVPPGATAGHGEWVRTANDAYLFTFRQIFYNADGSYAGGAKIRNSGRMNKPGDQMTGDLQFTYYDAGGAEVFAGNGTFTAVRINAEPLTP